MVNFRQFTDIETTHQASLRSEETSKLHTLIKGKSSITKFGVQKLAGFLKNVLEDMVVATIMISSKEIESHSV